MQNLKMGYPSRFWEIGQHVTKKVVLEITKFLESNFFANAAPAALSHIPVFFEPLIGVFDGTPLHCSIDNVSLYHHSQSGFF
jgi:hypothetical protein